MNIFFEALLLLWRDNMKSLILSTTIKILLPMMLLFSFFLLMRGHNLPGGGFTGGLVASAGFALYAIALGIKSTRQIMRIKPDTLLYSGLLITGFSGLMAVFSGKPFMTGLWLANEIPGFQKIGTPVLFDVGVYLVVLGMVTKIIFSLMEED